jgi:serine/threonine-protein kinase
MSPEQARGSKTIDHRSDLWAMAVVVYQCMTGRLPFMGEALGDLFVKIIVEPLPVPSRVASVPPGFDIWWARAAARDPAERFQTAKDFADNLGLALGVTVGAGVEIGSALASPDGAGGVPAGSGTVAMMTPSRPVTPYPGGGTPYPGGMPYPGAHTPYPGGSATPAPILGAAPTPMQQAMSVTASPAPSRAGLIVAGVVGVLALGGGAAFFALRARAPAPAPAVATVSTTVAPPPAASTAVTAVTAAPPAPATSEPATAPSASASAAVAAPVKGHAPGKPVPGAAAKPAAPAPPKDSLGF